MNLYTVTQTQTIVVAMLVGLGLALLIVLTHMMLWRPRHRESDAPPPESWREVWHYMPWALVLTLLGIAAYLATATILAAIHPPNW